jgi:hypothetical protein
VVVRRRDVATTTGQVSAWLLRLRLLQPCQRQHPVTVRRATAPALVVVPRSVFASSRTSPRRCRLVACARCAPAAPLCRVALHSTLRWAWPALSAACAPLAFPAPPLGWPALRAGIIDILQQYNVKKRGETLLKVLVMRSDRHEISSVEPNEYAARFVRFMEANTAGVVGEPPDEAVAAAATASSSSRVAPPSFKRGNK